MRSRLRQGTALLALACGLAYAQDVAAQRGGRLPRSIRGQVVNDQSRPVAWAYVSLQGEMGGVAATATTGPRGRFIFDGVEPDVYMVVARKGGYHRAGQRVDMTVQYRGYVQLTLYPDKTTQSAQPTSTDPTVSVQSLDVPEEAEEEFEKGREALLAKDDPAAGEKRFLRAIELYPPYVDAYQLLGASYLRQEKWEEAETAFRQALGLNPNLAPTYFGLAAVYKERNAADEAREALQQGLRLDPNSWTGHVELAMNLLERKDLEGAQRHALRAHELRPELPLAHVVLGNVELRRGTLLVAEEEYKHYLERAPNGPLATEIREKLDEIADNKYRKPDETTGDVPSGAQRKFQEGQREIAQGKIDQALQRFRKAVELYPEYVQAHHMVAVILMNQEQWENAENILKRCIELRSGFAPAYVALGSLYNDQGKPGEAMPFLERGVALEPRYWQGHFELARSLLAQNQVEEAETHARRAHELAADFPPIHVVLGNISLTKHDLVEARQEYQHYLDLAPGGALAAQLSAKIRQIDRRLGQ